MKDKLIAIGYKGCAFLPDGAPIALVRLNSYNVLNWQKPGAQARAFQADSLAGKVSGSIAHDLCLYVGKSQFGHCPDPKRKEVWIGELKVARKLKLVTDCEFNLHGKRVTGYAPVNVKELQYIATDALPGGRMETKKIKDSTGFDRNSSTYESTEKIGIRKFSP